MPLKRDASSASIASYANDDDFDDSDDDDDVAMPLSAPSSSSKVEKGSSLQRTQSTSSLASYAEDDDFDDDDDADDGGDVAMPMPAPSSSAKANGSSLQRSQSTASLASYADDDDNFDEDDNNDDQAGDGNDDDWLVAERRRTAASEAAFKAWLKRKAVEARKARRKDKENKRASRATGVPQGLVRAKTRAPIAFGRAWRGKAPSFIVYDGLRRVDRETPEDAAARATPGPAKYTRPDATLGSSPTRAVFCASLIGRPSSKSTLNLMCRVDGRAPIDAVPGPGKYDLSKYDVALDTRGGRFLALPRSRADFAPAKHDADELNDVWRRWKKEVGQRGPELTTWTHRPLKIGGNPNINEEAERRIPRAADVVQKEMVAWRQSKAREAKIEAAERRRVRKECPLNPHKVETRPCMLEPRGTCVVGWPMKSRRGTVKRRSRAQRQRGRGKEKGKGGGKRASAPKGNDPYALPPADGDGGGSGHNARPTWTRSVTVTTTTNQKSSLSLSIEDDSSGAGRRRSRRGMRGTGIGKKRRQKQRPRTSAGLRLYARPQALDPFVSARKKQGLRRQQTLTRSAGMSFGNDDVVKSSWGKSELKNGEHYWHRREGSTEWDL